MTILEVKNLNLFYGNNHALQDINMKIEKNEITALIGPSGCGKSTVLRTFNRMNDIIPDVKISGRVEFMEQDIYASDIDPMLVRKKIGMVFQKPNPFPMSIYDNITYALRYYKMRNKRDLDEAVEKSLSAAALWDEVKDRLKKPAMSLSGGQQQRLCIARTIALQPNIILMDEATSSLDPTSTFKIEELMQQLKKDYTVVIVTHNMQQAVRVSDKTAFFYLGKLVEYDLTQTIFSSPSEAKTLDYVTGRFG